MGAGLGERALLRGAVPPVGLIWVNGNVSDPTGIMATVYDSTPPLPADSSDLADLDDPVAGVVAVDLSRLFVRICLSWAEPMVGELAAREVTLRQPGGTALMNRLLVQRFYRRIDPEVFSQFSRCVPLPHAACALARAEEALREQFGLVVEIAAVNLLDRGRDAAIQLIAIAATVAGRDVRTLLAEIIAESRD